MKQPVSNFKEEFSSKLPALTLLTHLGCRFVPPLACKQMRYQTSHSDKGSSQVLNICYWMQELIKIIQELNQYMNLGLTAANEKLYNAMIYGITVTEFIDGKKASPTIACLIRMMSRITFSTLQRK
ncbi:MAG: hypothetical protein L3J83_08910 [Proteobacteria bacterium]|nr:hypothetical protein [Pseudomonadota bacterium]